MSQCKKLPPGWDSRTEPKSGKSYFVNYFTRNVSLEDPRIKTEPGTTPIEGAVRNGHPHRQVPVMGATAVLSNSAQAMEVVNRIRTTFPTVPETHIKALLIKYHGREALVVSALQVEKHPIRTPGPFTPPPPARILVPTAALPHVSRPQPKPHSPKMKLRYLKSVFPVVEETVLLDTLVNADNNVTHATEKLLNLGFTKRDIPVPRVCLSKRNILIPKTEPLRLADPPRPKSADEKEKMKERICSKHPEVPEKVVSIALESAAFNEDTAEKILSLTIDEKTSKSKEGGSGGEVVETAEVIAELGEASTDAAPLPLTDQESFKRRQKSNKNESRSDEDGLTASKALISRFVSPLLSKPRGPNKDLAKGPNESLLLEDYVPWMGAEKGLVAGADRQKARGSRGAVGSDSSLRKGPRPALARGSVYATFIASPPPSSRGK